MEMRRYLLIISFLLTSCISYGQYFYPLLGRHATGGFTPPTANLVAHYDATLGITIATGVSQWNDQSPNGYNLTQASGTLQPIQSGTGSSTVITFDGTNDYMKNTSCAFSQPYTIYIVYKAVTWTYLDIVYHGVNAGRTSFVSYSNSSPNMTLYDGGGDLASNTAMTTGTIRLSTQVWNGASSSIAVNDGTKTTINSGAGSGGSGGFVIGSDADGTSAANIAVQDIWIYSVADGNTAQTNMFNYLKAHWGFP